MAKPKPADYFLPPKNTLPNDPWQFRGPVSRARRIAPLIDGKAIFTALEEAVVSAEKSVLIAFWALDPNLKLLSKTAKQFGRQTWGDLLPSVANSGVLVRILMNDFDPAFQHRQHVFTWARYRRLVERARREAISEDRFQVVCARHDAEVPVDAVKAVRAGEYDKVAATLNNEERHARIAAFANSPGVWDKLRFVKKDERVVAKKPGETYPAYPAAYHQKILVVDGRLAFTGGINLIGENLDSPRHPAAAQLPWHDVFVTLEGEPVWDVLKNFFTIWNHERLRSENFLRDALKHSSVQMPVRRTTDLDFNAVPFVDGDKKKPPIAGQIQRTISRKGGKAMGVPDVVNRGILDGYLQAINLAESFVYIENQYFRERSIADALIARHSKKPDLQTIIVLPKIAEELLNQQGDPITFHGAALQHEALEAMRSAIGSNLGLFTLVTGENEQVVYVHSKLVIVDDLYAGVGSANANPRSMRMDTELHFAWYDGRTTRRLRETLWNEILGSGSGMGSWRPRQYVQKWSDLAKRNAAIAPKNRKRFVVPFANDLKGIKLPVIPDEFA